MKTPKDKVIELMDKFGITGVKAAEAMGITYGTYNNKKNEKEKKHCFNEKNYQDLVNFIKEKAKELD